jgi:hypothetical protein
MIPMVIELERLAKRLLVKAASDMIHGILGTGSGLFSTAAAVNAPSAKLGQRRLPSQLIR